MPRFPRIGPLVGLAGGRPVSPVSLMSERKGVRSFLGRLGIRGDKYPRILADVWGPTDIPQIAFGTGAAVPDFRLKRLAARAAQFDGDGTTGAVYLYIEGTAATDAGYVIRLAGEAGDRAAFVNTGISMGDGTGARDTSLIRSGAKTMEIGAAGFGALTDFHVFGRLYPDSVRWSVPSGNSISADQNDFAPVAGTYVRVLNNGVAHNITGMVAGGLGEFRVITNDQSGSGGLLTLKYNSGSSAAGNRFAGNKGVDLVLGYQQSVVVIYDGTFWVMQGGDVVPQGVILMWSGETTTIPAGWALCDGTAPTPDLRDRFIIGADTTNENTSGGTVSASAALATHATHATHAGHSNHAVTQPTAHGGLTTGGPSATFAVLTSSVSSTPTATHNHTVPLTNNHVGTAVDAHSAHAAHDAHDVHAIIKFYRLAFIMKL